MAFISKDEQNEIRIQLIRDKKFPELVKNIRIIYPDRIKELCDWQDVDFNKVGLHNALIGDDDIKELEDDNGWNVVQMNFIGKLETVYE